MLNAMLQFLAREIDKLKYDVGDLYVTENPNMDTVEKVEARFGGVWEKREDEFILATGKTYKLGARGGSATHTLTIDEMPKHKHEFASYSPTGNAVPEYYGHLAQYAGTSSGWSARVGYEGGNESHNNMPPYRAYYVYVKVGGVILRLRNILSSRKVVTVC